MQKYFYYYTVCLLNVTIIFLLQASMHDCNKILLEAAKKHDAPAIEKALAAGADINTQDEHGRTALMYVCQWQLARWNTQDEVLQYYQNQAAIITYLLTRRDININIQDTNANTALLIAARGINNDMRDFSNKNSIALLLAHGADTRDYYKEFPPEEKQLHDDSFASDLSALMCYIVLLDKEPCKLL